ncbi:MAG: sulfotransferase [Planctomycetota bacterium]
MIASFSRSQNLGYQIGLISFTRPANILRQARHLFEIHPRFAARMLLVAATSLAGTPLRLWERVVHGRRIAGVRVPDPVFIIGHWRSGTTHLHNLMSLNPEFGYVSNFQATVPDFSLVGPRWLKPILQRVVPQKRPMDNMTWPMDAPQEEEIPLAKMMPFSFYTQFLFPRQTLRLFRQYVLRRGAPSGLDREFERAYYRVLQIATLHSRGKRLMLKNPVNTARIPQILALFPNAKFVHIHRAPHEVFASTANLRGKLLPITTLQKLGDHDPTETILALYEDLMRRYLTDRERIPAGNLVEVRFDDLEREPIETVRQIHKALDLPGLTGTEPRLRDYCDAQRSYRKNRLALPVGVRQRVEARWAFAFEAFGYARG